METHLVEPDSEYGPRGVRVVLNGIEIPVVFAITPDWADVLHHYPEWVERAVRAGKPVWELQPYMIGYSDELGKTKFRDRTGKDWMNRYFEHWGLGHLEDSVKRFRHLWETGLLCAACDVNMHGAACNTCTANEYGVPDRPCPRRCECICHCPRHERSDLKRS